MFFLTYIASIFGIIYFICGALLLLFRNSKSLDTTLGFYLISTAVWIESNVVADISYTSDWLIISSGLAFIAGGINLFISLIVIDLVVEERIPPIHRLSIYGVLTLAITPLAFSDLGVAGVIFPQNAPAQIVPGVIYNVAAVLLLACLAYGSSRLIYSLNYIHENTKRMQILLVLSGLLITITSQVLFDIILPIFGELRFFELGPICSIFFAVCVGYATVRHHLFEVKAIFQLGLVYTSLFLSVILIYLVVLYILTTVLGSVTNMGIYISSGVSVLIGTFSIPYLDRYLKRVTDALFFKDKYEYADAMHILSGILYTAKTPGELISQIEKNLSSILRSEKVRIILLDEEIDMIEALPGHLIFPILSETQTIGYIEVGLKRSGEQYKAVDIKLLNTFVYQASTALARVRLHQQVEKYTEELEDKVKERTQEIYSLHEQQKEMILDISHTLQTPITIFKIKLEGLRGRNLKDTDFQSLERTINNISLYIKDLLQLAHLEQVTNTEKDYYKLDEVIQDLCEEIEVIAASRSIQIVKEIEENITIFGDPRQIRTVVINLISNSLKYIGKRKIRKINISLRVLYSNAEIIIQDSGCGIEQSALNKIFDRFYRSKDHQQNIPGSGLGLAIVKQLVELEGGSIWVSSVINRGTIFTVKLPLLRKSAQGK
ncbi:MAG: two-component system, cell cycle sensor histidine kinase PleC [Parcubacteria bacterium C7867-008]|nr:MAG: two-component system, cell cycle sensor histidine kinase PleC [Parcubacteria bacterium C7867-008]